jgi:hypothetical protein
MSPAPDMSGVLAPFQRVFTAPPWRKAQMLLIGTLLARGRRTVTAALRQMGLSEATHFSLYHHVLNRARWSALQASHQLLVLLMRTFVTRGGMLTFVIGEKLERRWGPCIKKRGQYRDPLASSTQRSVATSGLRWSVLALVITPPWTQRSWALPVLSVPAPRPEVSHQLGLRHKTVARRARQMLLARRRWLPDVQLTVLDDQAYSVLNLGRACSRHGVRLIAPLRLEAALYAPAPPRDPGTNGRPRVNGERLPALAQVLTDGHTVWQRLRVRWDDGRWRDCELVTTRRGPYPHRDGGVEVRKIFHKLRPQAIEPCNGLFKNVFEWRMKMPVKGLQRSQLLALGAVVVYQLALRYQHERHLPLGKGIKPLLRAA